MQIHDRNNHDFPVNDQVKVKRNERKNEKKEKKEERSESRRKGLISAQERESNVKEGGF